MLPGLASCRDLLCHSKAEEQFLLCFPVAWGAPPAYAFTWLSFIILFSHRRHCCCSCSRSFAVVCLQVQYSLLDRRPENGMAAYCAEQGIKLLPYGVLAGGILSEKYLGAKPDE